MYSIGIRYNIVKLVNLTTLHTISYAIVFIYFSYLSFCYPTIKIRNRVVKKDKRTKLCSTRDFTEIKRVQKLKLCMVQP
jgi:hypothetical protein